MSPKRFSSPCRHIPDALCPSHYVPLFYYFSWVMTIACMILPLYHFMLFKEIERADLPKEKKKRIAFDFTVANLILVVFMGVSMVFLISERVQVLAVIHLNLKYKFKNIWWYHEFVFTFYIIFKIFFCKKTLLARNY